MTEVIHTSETGGSKGRKPETYSLIPAGPLAELARVYGYGAGKYTFRHPLSSCVSLLKVIQLESCENITKLLHAIQIKGMPLTDFASNATLQNIQRLSGQNVTQIDLQDFVDSVAAAMIENSRKEIQSTRNDKTKIIENGPKQTETISEIIKKDIRSAEETGNESEKHQSQESLHCSDSPKNLHPKFLETRAAAGYAALGLDQEASTLTTITKPENSGDSYAKDAIKELVCSEITKQAFARLSNTSNLSIEGEFLVESGSHNWRKGYPYSWSIDSLYRHIEAFRSGQNLDPESGLHHLAHANFHLMTLQEFQGAGSGKDDRYLGKE